ncbi:MAG: ShlB/FhaC/HecB family hemolysin secretion/activation protein [Syntrophorhabdales bacterium]|jgi:hemolysin activation/secretion protein
MVRTSPILPGLRIWPALLLLSLVCLLLPADPTHAAEEAVTFEVLSFTVEGNTIMPGKKILDLLQQYKGPGKTAGDVEKARDALEKMYHDAGYPAVLVNLPEQTVKGGRIILQVIESKIGNVRVSGNRWFTQEKILRDLPSLAPGKVLYVPAVQEDLMYVNRGQDLKVSPGLSPGTELGLTDVDLKVEDQLPLHGNLELNNRATQNTTDLRLNAMLRYDNLWQMDHSVSAQFQVSPEDTGQVKMYALSYTLPAPWMRDQQIAVYGVKSDSNTTVFGQGLLINGKGSILGLRYVIPLAPYAAYAHNVTLGIDYKDFKDTTGFMTGGGVPVPVRYAPLLFSYSSSLPDARGATRFSAGLNVAVRSLVSNVEQFEDARYQTRGNYLYLTAGVERDVKLPAGMGLFLKLDGQIADQPLISHEQYLAGGMMNVRGYDEAEVMGDDAFHGTTELSAPDLGPLLGLKKIQVTPYIFYDYAWLEVINPLPSQRATNDLQGTGAGLRGTAYKNFYYELDLAFPLVATSQTSRYSEHWYFKTGVQF